MAKSSNDLTNYKRYLNNLKHRGINSPPDHEESLNEIIAEGNRLLEQEAQTTSTKSKVSPPNTPSDNPYLRARKKILSEMTEERRKLIDRLEKEGKTDSYQYKDFVAQVHKLGDIMSN